MDLDWLTNAEIKSSLELQDLIVDKTRKYIFQLLFDRIRYVALCSEKSEGQYSVKNIWMISTLLFGKEYCRTEY